MSTEEEKRLTGFFKNDQAKSSSVCIEAKLEKIASKMGKSRAPNKIKKVSGIDLPMEAAGVMSCSALKKKMFIPCVKQELEKRGVQHNANANVTSLVMLIEQDEGTEKTF